MGKRLAQWGGVGPVLVGLGLGVSGLTSLWVGVLLMALGAAWTLGVVTVPPALRRMSLAVVRTGMEQLPAAPASTPTIANGHTRKIRLIAQHLRDDLDDARRQIEEARGYGHYWESSISHWNWTNRGSTLAAEPGALDAYTKTRDAYRVIDELNDMARNFDRRDEMHGRHFNTMKRAVALIDEANEALLALLQKDDV
jgi:hypothetical protein